MDKMDLYTKEETDFLKEYYKDKILNKTFGSIQPIKITGFVIEKIKVKYQLICVGHSLRQPDLHIKTDISTLCKDYSLLSPLDALKGQH